MGREEKKAVPCCCNYITASLVAPRPLTQLFLENIKFIVSFEIMRSLRLERRGFDVRCTRWRTHNVSGMALTDWGILGYAVHFLRFASNMLMVLWDCFHSQLVAPQVPYGEQNISGVLFLYIPHIHSRWLGTLNPKEDSHPYVLSLFSPWIDDFLAFVLRPHIFNRP